MTLRISFIFLDPVNKLYLIHGYMGVNGKGSLELSDQIAGGVLVRVSNGDHLLTPSTTHYVTCSIEVSGGIFFFHYSLAEGKQNSDRSSKGCFFGVWGSQPDATIRGSANSFIARLLLTVQRSSYLWIPQYRIYYTVMRDVYM